MPLIKQDALPVSRQELDALRARLQQAYQFELVVREDQRFLFLRSPRAEPDPIADLEDCLERVPDWAVNDVQDAFLLGDLGSFHVHGSTLQPVLDRRQRIDATLLSHWRDHLDPHYGLGLHRIAGDPLNLVRLGLRLPRDRVADLDEADLVRVARAAGPLLETGEAQTIRLVYLLAEQDHVRLGADDFFSDVRPRWEELQRPPPPPPLEPAPPAARVPRRRPTKVLNVRPALDIETHLDASLNPELDLAQLAEAETRLETLLRERNFKIRPRVEHESTTYALAAERQHGYPRRVLVKTCPRLARDDVDLLLQEVRSLEADLLVVVILDADDDARRRTVATKVKVIRPDEVAALAL
ncbi:MAG: hypothetical protein HYT80_04995 [Euryarchaeota archaeon]|nr:hypothetical protein [Euryarchaeota archaeon]